LKPLGGRVLTTACRPSPCWPPLARCGESGRGKILHDSRASTTQSGRLGGVAGGRSPCRIVRVQKTAIDQRLNDGARTALARDKSNGSPMPTTAGHALLLLDARRRGNDQLGGRLLPHAAGQRLLSRAALRALKLPAPPADGLGSSRTARDLGPASWRPLQALEQAISPEQRRAVAGPCRQNRNPAGETHLCSGIAARRGHCWGRRSSLSRTRPHRGHSCAGLEIRKRDRRGAVVRGAPACSDPYSAPSKIVWLLRRRAAGKARPAAAGRPPGELCFGQTGQTAGWLWRPHLAGPGDNATPSIKQSGTPAARLLDGRWSGVMGSRVLVRRLRVPAQPP